jgi:hypothetical protein
MEAEVITEPEPRAAAEVKEPEAHPAAEIFPQLMGEELSELAGDIKRHGLRQPIWMLSGKILDGRNRWRACQMAGVEPKTVEYEGADPVAFVISQNLRRRHLTASQLAVVAVDIERLYASKAKVGRPRNGVKVDPISKRSAIRAAEAVGVSNGYVKQAKAITKASPGLAKEVKEGRKTIPAAQRELKSKEKPNARRIPEALRSVSVIGEFVRSGVLKQEATSPIVIEFVEHWKKIADMHGEFVG